MKRTVSASVILLLLLLFWMTPFVGCGSKEAEKEEERAVEEEAVTEEKAVAEETAAGREAEEGAETEEGAEAGPPAGYLYERQEIGSKTPLEYLQLVDVRWSDHGDYFRLVAELKRLDGSDTTQVPWCFADYSDDPTIEYGTEIQLYMRGIRREDVHVASLRAGEGKLTGDAVCPQVLMTMHGSVDGVEPVNLFVTTRTKRPFRLSYATAPLRIILDVWK